MNYIKNFINKTELIKLVKNKKYEQVDKLLNKNKDDINKKNLFGESALHIAGYNNNDLKMVKILIYNGANINIKDSDGNSVLLKCCSDIKYLKIIKFLIKLGADVNSKGHNGFTPLLSACYESSNDMNYEIVKLLLKNGAKKNVRTKMLFEKKTPKDYAKERNNKKMFLLLK